MRTALALLLSAAIGAAADRPLVLVIDQSASMQTNDPFRYAVDAAQLAVATLRPEKQVLVVGFARTKQVIIPWTGFAAPGSRQAVRDKLANLSFTGTATYYSGALQLTADQMQNIQAGSGSRVFFVTDGNPDDDSDDIAQATRRFAERGWIVEAMRINKDGKQAKPDLRGMAVATRGSHIEVVDAGKLVDHFIGLTNAENDFFDLDVEQVEAARSIAVPEGAERLTYVVVKGAKGGDRGVLVNLAANGVPIDLDSAEHYRYPAQRAAKGNPANIEVAVVNNPLPGTYTCDFLGTPQRVYVSISFPVRVEPLPVPAEVYEGAVVNPGVAVISGGGDRARRMAASATVEAVLTDTVDGSVLYRGPLPNAGAAGAAVKYTRDWPATLAAAADRTVKHPIECSFSVRVGPYRLGKRAAFIIDPAKKVEPPPPPPPAALTASATGGGDLPPTWTGMPANGAFAITTAGATDAGSLTFSGGPQFTYAPVAIPAEAAAVAVTFQSPAPGRFADRPTATHPRAAQPIAGPAITGRAYAWLGRDELVLTGSGPTPVAGWVGRHDDLPVQAFRGAQVRLSDPQGRTVDVVLGVDGAAAVGALPADRPRTTYAGQIDLRYGDLPPRRIAVRMDDAPPATRLAFEGDGLDIKPGAQWQPGTWAESPQRLRMESGVPGKVAVVLSDLTGPEGEVLSAARDLRAVIAAERISGGEPARFTIRVFRGRDVPSGDYRGTATITYTADNGSTETIARDIVVAIP